MRKITKTITKTSLELTARDFAYINEIYKLWEELENTLNMKISSHDFIDLIASAKADGSNAIVNGELIYLEYLN